MLYDVAGGDKAKVSDVLLNGSWKMLPAKSEAAQIQSGLSSIPLCEDLLLQGNIKIIGGKLP